MLFEDGKQLMFPFEAIDKQVELNLKTEENDGVERQDQQQDRPSKTFVIDNSSIASEAHENTSSIN